MLTLKELMEQPQKAQTRLKPLHRMMKFCISYSPIAYFAWQSNFQLIPGLKFLGSLLWQEFINNPLNLVLELPILCVAFPLLIVLIYPIKDLLLKNNNDFEKLNAASLFLVSPVCGLLYKEIAEDRLTLFDDWVVGLMNDLDLTQKEFSRLLAFLKDIQKNHPQIQSNGTLDEDTFINLIASHEQKDELIPIFAKVFARNPQLIYKLEELKAQSGAIPLRDHRTLTWLAAKAAVPLLDISEKEVKLKARFSPDTEKEAHIEAINNSPHLKDHLNRVKDFSLK